VRRFGRRGHIVCVLLRLREDIAIVEVGASLRLVSLSASGKAESCMRKGFSCLEVLNLSVLVESHSFAKNAIEWALSRFALRAW
jgi:hypothetical protein